MPRPREILPLTWREYLAHMRDTWEPGEHIGLVAPTGSAKTTFLGGLARTRRYVLALDQKGGDKTLDQLGWERIDYWPPRRRDYDEMAEGPWRRIVGSRRRDRPGREQRRAFHRRVLDGVMTEGKFTVMAPDLGALASRQLGNAWDEIVEMLILLRDAGGSFITDFHALRRIPPEAPENVTYLGIGYTRDRELVTDLARSMGTGASEMHGAIEALGDLPYGWIVVSRRPRDPLILTRPEKLGK